jgi:uncharacterized protein (TIGR02001 family)
MKKIVHSAVFASTLAFAGHAAAADAVFASEPVFAPTQEEVASAIDVAFGIGVTSQYVSRGVALSKGAAVQGYVELSYDWLYAGAWGSTVSGVNSDPNNFELDLYAGIRPTFGDLTLDIGYVHYLYDETGECCGEAYVKADYSFTEEFAAGLAVYRDFPNDTTYGAATASYALPYDLSLSGSVGTYFDSEYDWNVGISYTYNETLTLDARYHDATTQPARFVASVSFDTSWSALRR